MNKGDKVILFGGSFDPPHIGHMVVSQWLAEALQNPVRLLLSGSPPHKNPQGSGAHRLEMLKIATRDNPSFIVDEYEYSLGRVNYSADTVKRYQEDFQISQENLYFAVGSDSLRDFHLWQRPQEIVERVTLVAFARTRVDWHELLLPLKDLKAKIMICKAPIIEVSSTLIRERIKQGLSIRYLVTPAVEEYIVKKGLYQEGL